MANKQFVVPTGSSPGGGGGGGTVTSVTASSPLASSGGATPNISVTSSTGTGAIVLAGGSPTFTATPAAPTAAPGTNTTQLATTAFVTAAVAAAPGTVTSVTGTANQIDVATGTTTPVLTISSTLITPGTVTVSQAGALSQAAVSITGAPITGGTATTTFPLVYLNSGVAPTTWSTSGTNLGINAPSGFGGNFVDFHVNGGASVFKVAGTGAVTSTNSYIAGATSQYSFSSSTRIVNNSDGVLALQNTAQTDFGRLQFGGTTSSFPSIKRSGTLLNFRLADDSGDSGIITATELITAGNAASTSSLSVTGAPFTGGSGTTTFPLVYINSGTAPTTFSTSGTVLGINAPSGFAGNFLDFHLNGGASVFSVSSTGALSSNLTIAAVSNITSSGGTFITSNGGGFIWAARTKMLSPSDGVLELTNSGITDFSRLQFGGTTSSFPALKRSTSVLQFDLADDSALTYFNWGGQSRVSTQFDVTSSAVLANVTGLSVNVVAGRTYTFVAELHTTTGISAGGTSFAISGTATATAIIYQATQVVSSTGAIVPTTTARLTSLGGAVVIPVGVSTTQFTRIVGTITVNAAGTLTTQFSQNTSNGTASSVLVGSTFVVYDTP